MISIHIVTHVYAKTLPQYAVFLRAQLSSLCLYPSPHFDGITVCYTPGDERVEQVLDDFGGLLGDKLILLPLPAGSLFRRCIGRNQVALECKTDLLWATDVDHVFGEGCLDSLAQAWSVLTTPKPVLVYPEVLQIQSKHWRGDQFVSQNMDGRGLLRVDTKGFQDKSYSGPVGGVHIINGDYARWCGYLNGMRKWFRPEKEDQPFRCFRDDRKFSQVCASKGIVETVQVTGLYRLRHTATTYQG